MAAGACNRNSLTSMDFHLYPRALHTQFSKCLSFLLRTYTMRGGEHEKKKDKGKGKDLGLYLSHVLTIFT